MYPITNTVKALFDAEQKKVLRITGTDRNGATISITDANVMNGSFNVDRYSCNGQKIEVGTAIASQMTIRLNNENGAYDNIVFEGAELFVEIGIADWSQSSVYVYYIPCGYFTPDEQPRRLSIITLKALDRMTRFDAVQPTLMPWTDNYGNAIKDNNGNAMYFNIDLAFPCTIAQLVSMVCNRCNVPFSQNLSDFPNYNYTVSALPSMQQDITYRNIIQWCAGIMGTCAFIDYDGSLKFRWYSAANYTTTPANRYSSDLQENDITLTGAIYTNSQNVTIVSGSADYAIDLTGNGLVESGIATILPAVKNALNGFSYRPFSASVIAAPYLWPLDIITFTDKDGVDHNCILTNVNFGLNGATTLEGRGETSAKNKGVINDSMTPEQARLVEQAYDVAMELDKSLDQEGVFNRLTNNGAAQGMYIVDGQVYVNMTYLRSGTLVLGGLNNQSGVLRVLNANGDEIGKWGSDGIRLSDGSIYFPVQNNLGSGYIALNEDGIPLSSLFTTSNGSCLIRFDNFAISLTDQNDASGETYSVLGMDNLTLRNGRDNTGTFPRIELTNTLTGDTVVMTPQGIQLSENGSQVGYILNSGAYIPGYLTAETLYSSNGASGTFTTADGKTVTVTSGVITGIADNTAPVALTVGATP